MVQPAVQVVAVHIITEPVVQEILHQFHHLKVIQVFNLNQVQVQHRAMLVVLAEERQQQEHQVQQVMLAVQEQQVQ